MGQGLRLVVRTCWLQIGIAKAHKWREGMHAVLAPQIRETKRHK
jgi:hypothetical protein